MSPPADSPWDSDARSDHHLRSYVAAAICLSFTLAWGHLLVSPQVSVFFVEYGGFLFLPALLAEFACPFAMFLLLTSRRHSLGTFIRLVLAELLLCLTLPYLLWPAVW